LFWLVAAVAAVAAVVAVVAVVAVAAVVVAVLVVTASACLNVPWPNWQRPPVPSRQSR
jgi:hypothetical protein